MTARFVTALTCVFFLSLSAASSGSFAKEPAVPAGPESALGSTDFTLGHTAGFPAWKNDGVVNPSCRIDSTRVCETNATLIAQGAPVPVPTLPPSGLIILGLLIVGTTAYTLTKKKP